MTAFDLADRALLLTDLVRVEREIAALHAEQLRLLAALQALPHDDPKQYAREEVATTLRWSAAATRERMALADEAQRVCPQLLDALADGRISLGHLLSFRDLTRSLDEPTAGRVAQRVVDYAATHHVADFRRKVKREIAKLDPVSLATAARRAVEDRRVWSAPDAPGITFVGAYLPAAGAAELMAALSWLATERGADDERTKDQRVADALVQLGRDVLAGGCGHCGLSSRPVGPAVQVTVALSTLLDADEQAGELNGEIIPASLARQLAADPEATWRRLVTDDLGHLIDYGRTTYRPPAALRDHVVARDRRCRFPGCGRQAATCEVDHIQPWEDGGATNHASLISLCPRHHHAKHEAGWHVTQLPDGYLRWTSPAGKVHVVEPATYPLDRTSLCHLN